MAEQQRLLTEREVAELLSVSRMTLKRRRRDGLAPRAIRIGKSVRYDRRDVASFLEASKGSAPAGVRP